MSELIPLTQHDGIQAVMGRDLYNFLGVETEYRHWLPRMVEYGFEEGKDYAVKNDRVQDSLGRSRERTNHIITLDMAKEISMIQRTEKGKQARQYFLECERKAAALALPQTYAEALRELASTYEEKEQARRALEVAQPKADYVDDFVADEDLIQFRTLANQLGIGEHKLRATLQDHRWIYDDVTTRWSNRNRRMVNVHRWRAMADKKPYFRLVPQHEVPRINGEVQQTLKIRPAGAVAIRKALTRWGVLA